MPLIFVFWVEVSVFFCIGVLDDGIWSSVFCHEIVELLCRACSGLPLTSSGAKLWELGTQRLVAVGMTAVSPLSGLMNCVMGMSRL